MKLNSSLQTCDTICGVKILTNDELHKQEEENNGVKDTVIPKQKNFNDNLKELSF